MCKPNPIVLLYIHFKKNNDKQATTGAKERDIQRKNTFV